MKSNVTFEEARLFGIKPLGNGCRFGIKVSSKKQDGTYTKGSFANCKCTQMLQEGINYNLSGFLGDNEYNDKNTLEIILMSAVPCGAYAPRPQAKPKPQQMAEEFDEETIPF